MKTTLIVLLVLWSNACAGSTLEQHIRSARDVAVLNERIVVELDNYCIDAVHREVCSALVSPAQDSLAVSLDTWTRALDRERDAGHWDEPLDGVEATNVGVAYDALARVCEANSVLALPPLPASYCDHTGASSCPQE
jgi:hypothetical protein